MSRIHFADLTEHVPLCIVEGTIIVTDDECRASRKRAEVTCRQCLDLLGPVLEGRVLLPGEQVTPGGWWPGVEYDRQKDMDHLIVFGDGPCPCDD